MLIELYAVKVLFSGLSWNWTAIGTVVLALATFAALGYTIRATRQDRAQAKTDREEANKRLNEEREAATGALRPSESTQKRFAAATAR